MGGNQSRPSEKLCGVVRGSEVKWVESLGKNEITLSVDGVGPDEGTSRTVDLWETDKNGADQPWLPLVREAAFNRDLELRFSGYLKDGKYFKATEVERFDPSKHGGTASGHSAQQGAPAANGAGNGQTPAPVVLAQPGPAQPLSYTGWARWGLEQAIASAPVSIPLGERAVTELGQVARELITEAREIGAELAARAQGAEARGDVQQQQAVA